MPNPRDVNLDIVGHDHTGRATRSAEHNLDRLNRKLGSVKGASEGVNRSLSGMGASIASSVNSTGLVAIAALAVGFAPAVTSLIGAAIIAGGVFGMVGLAAYIQRNNPLIKAAAKRLTDDIGRVFTEASGPLVAPMLAALARFDGAVKALGPSLRAMFVAVGPSITKMADALVGMVTFALPGFISMLQDAQPVTDAIARMLPRIGFALGQMFAIIGTGAPDIAVAVDDLTTLLMGAVVAIGLLIKYGAKMYVAMRDSTTQTWDSFKEMARIIAAAWGTILSAVGSAIAKVGGMMAGIIRVAAKAADAVGLHGTADKLRANAAEIAAHARGIQRSIDSLHGKNIAIKLSVDTSAYYRAKALAGRGIQVPFGGGPSFEATAPGGGRTQAPSQPSFNVDSRVYLDGQLIDSRARTLVTDSATRQAWRASTGRR